VKSAHIFTTARLPPPFFARLAAKRAQLAHLIKDNTFLGKKQEKNEKS
jgi:hypothetical protein